VHALNIVANIVQVVVALVLIFIVAIQQSKNEGLGGVIGGHSASNFKGMPSFEDRLTEWTRNLGIAFLVISILVAVTTNR